MSVEDGPDLEVVSEVARKLFLDLLGREAPAEEVAAVIREVLHGRKDLWQATMAGLITTREAASGVATHLHTWMIHKYALAWDPEGTPERVDIISGIEKALFGASTPAPA